MGKEGDYQLHLRPGTDGAMALAWTNVVIENELYDKLFVKKWTNGPFLVVRGPGALRLDRDLSLLRRALRCEDAPFEGERPG